MPSASVPSGTTAAAKVAPSEVNVYDVSWAFVPQYYTFMNKQPDRLHCFYTKNSTFIHGTEGEDGKPCYGQQEIHNKILSIGFQDCKVFIHSVDAQSSANGGIIIQVIGEMSNNAEPWRKFAQTFFLAEQPHGYFVLNDIFRFLKEETADEESSDADAAVEHTETAPAAEPLLSAQPAHPIHTPAEPVAPVRVPTPDVVAPEPAPIVTNGTHDLPEVDAPVAEVALPVETPAEPVVEPKEPTPSPPSPVPQPRAITPVQTPTPAPEAAVPTPVAKPVAPSPAPSPAPPPAPSTPAAPPKPAAPKTWANLAAANPTKWGSQVAQDARGVSAAAPPVSAAPAPAPQQKNGVPRSAPGASNAEGTQKDAHPAVTAANSVTTAQCFVKSVTENVSQNALRDVLVARFGSIKELEIIRSKACAFLEFTTVDSARRAIIASLPLSQGGEGGIRITEGHENPHSRDVPRITVETRKERGERPPPRPRTGPPGGEMRGGFRGLPNNRGRGAGPARGGSQPQK